MFRHSKGFTLIELLVVVAIIGMLSSVVLAALGEARANARDARRAQDIRQFQTALELYYSSTNNSYPLDSAADGQGTQYLLSSTSDDLEPTYMPSLPIDPLYGDTTSGYRYGTNDSGTMYTILINFEGDSVGWCEVRGGAGDPHWPFELCDVF